MEYRFNTMFKKHLEEVELYPSCVTASEHVSTVCVEEDYSRLHLNKLCKMMENCEIELQNSSATMRQLVDKDGDFLIVHKNEIKKLFVDLKEDFQSFKEELKEDFQKCIFNISVGGNDVKSRTLGKKEQDDACLTPPCSFETKPNCFESGNFASVAHTFIGKSEKTGVSMSPLYKHTPPIITYKVGKKNMKFQHQLPLPRRTSPRFTQRSQSRVSPRIMTKPPNKIKQTKHWLDTLQASTFSSPTNNEDTESVLSDWSCRSVRRAKKRGPIKSRAVQSETGFEHQSKKKVWDNNRDYRSNI